MSGTIRSTNAKFVDTTDNDGVILLHIRQHTAHPEFADLRAFTMAQFNAMASDACKTTLRALNHRDTDIGLVMYALLQMIQENGLINPYKMLTRLCCMFGQPLSRLITKFQRVEAEHNMYQPRNSTPTLATYSDPLDNVFVYLTKCIQNSRQTVLHDGVDEVDNISSFDITSAIRRWVVRGFDLIEDEESLTDPMRRSGAEYSESCFSELEPIYYQRLLGNMERLVVERGKDWALAQVDVFELPPTALERVRTNFDATVRHGQDLRIAWRTTVVDYLQSLSLNSVLETHGEHLYYSEPRQQPEHASAEASRWSFMIDTIQKALRIHSPVLLMLKQPTEFRVHLTADEEAGLATNGNTRRQYMWRLKNFDQVSEHSPLFGWTLMGAHELYHRVEELRHPIGVDTNDLLNIITMLGWNATAVLMLYNWATRYLALRSDFILFRFNADPKRCHEIDTKVAPYEDVARMIAMMPLQAIRDLAKMSGLGFPIDTIPGNEVRNVLLKFRPGNIDLTEARRYFGVMEILIGFENLRQQQYSMMLAVRSVLQSGRFRTIATAPPTVARFFRIFSKLGEDSAKFIARSYTGEQYGKPIPWDMIAAFRSVDLKNFLSGEGSQWLLQQDIDPMTRLK